MKPVTAAAKLGIYLPAAPEEFRTSPITRAQLDALRADPPQWLTDLRRNGPFPREVVAQKLGVSRSGLARAGITEPLDTDPFRARWSRRRWACPVPDSRGPASPSRWTPTRSAR